MFDFWQPAMTVLYLFAFSLLVAYPSSNFFFFFDIHLSGRLIVVKGFSCVAELAPHQT